MEPLPATAAALPPAHLISLFRTSMGCFAGASWLPSFHEDGAFLQPQPPPPTVAMQPLSPHTGQTKQNPKDCEDKAALGVGAGGCAGGGPDAMCSGRSSHSSLGLWLNKTGFNFK